MKKYLWVVSLVLVLGLLLSACGGAAAPEQQAPAPAQEEEAAASSEGGDEAATVAESGGTAAPKDGLAPELSVYNWADYIDEAILTNYEKEYGVKIVYDTFASNEDLLAKLQAGATGYDIIVPSDYMVAQMIELGLLAEIDLNNIPNIKNVDPRNLDAPYDPGNKHCVPYQWGTTGIAYSTEVYKDTPPDSWAYLFDPEKAKMGAEAGGINVLNDQRELLGAVLKYLGYSLNSKDEAQLQEAKEVLMAVKPYIKTFNSEDYEQSLLIPGEVVISQSWSGNAANAAAETDGKWAYAIPKEGGMKWQDNMCVTATSQKKATAEHFMNYILEAENGAALTNVTYYSSPNAAAKEFIKPEILNDPTIFPSDEVLNKLEWAEPLGETVFLYDQIWTEIKSQ
ncbi:MAG: spermidine/putrescine ABC transporter substrate-binding protein [Anaerolineae bacterium]|nr:spermidine/putrescine ABC transporter substrate-binding protein [Anaerolineae bacterium]